MVSDSKNVLRMYDSIMFLRFLPGDVEMDIDYLYKAVPQLAKVFRIIDKIGEGKCSAWLNPRFI